MPDTVAPATTARPDYRSRSTWVHLALLAVTAALLAIGTSIAFAPGGLYSDTRWQLQQAIGTAPLSDWHPAIMTINWKWLIDLTGHTSVLLYIQVLMMFGTGLGFAVYLYDVTRSRAWSYVGLGFLLLPHIFTYIGALLKDTQMAEMFFLAVVCALLAQRFKRLRWPLLIIGLLALTYGTAVRKNAFFAVLPLIYLLSFSTLTLWSKRVARTLRSRLLDPRFAALTAAVLALVIGSGAALNAIYQPEKTHQVSQVMLDDVIFTVPGHELEAMPDLDPEFRDKLREAQRTCRENGSYQDAYWRCYGRGINGGYTPIKHVDELQDLWIEKVLPRPDRYLLYRTQTFAHLLFGNYAEWGGKMEDNPMGWKVKYEQAHDAGKTYVESFGMEDLPWLFTGWFWLLSSIVIVAAHKSVRRLSRAAAWPHLSTAVMTLSLSAAIYIIGFFPIVPSTHYRYVYWPALAVSMAVVMLGAAAKLAWKARRQTAGGHTVETRISGSETSGSEIS